MKKLLVPAALLLIVACASPFLKEKENAPVAVAVKNSFIPTPVQKEVSVSNFSPAPQEEQIVKKAFTPTFTALNIPEEMKQHFTLNPKASQVVVGESGTMILIPDNAFADANGKDVSGKVKMEIVEGIKTADILKMNLGTMSDQGPLETGGMIYVNAFSEAGDTLQLAEGKQLEIEMPTDNKKSQMKLWTGITNADGSVSWTDPQPLKEELRQIPLSALEENAGRNDKDPDDGIFGDEQNVIARKGDFAPVTSGFVFIDSLSANASYSWGGNFVTKTINFTDKKFDNTNIATEEFRSRLPFIRQCCDPRVMFCYTDFPNRPLRKSDAAAADTLEKSGCALADVFRQFANLKQDKVNPTDSNTVAALNEAREKAIRKYSENVRAAKRYSSYSFGQKTLGWANVDRLANGNKLIFLNAHVEGISAGDNLAVTLIVPSRSIMLGGYKRPNGDYSFTHGEMELMAAYPTGTEAFILARSGSGDNMKFDLKKFIFGQNRIEELSLHAGTDESLALEMGNEPPQKEEPEKAIDDWYTKALRSGNGCLCSYATSMK